MYAVLRIAKLKSMGEIGGLGTHNERTRETRNADEARRDENVRLVGSGDWCADAQARLDQAPRIRSNAVLAIEHVMTASRDFYHQGDPAARAQRLDDWTERSMAWLRERYGAQNVVAAVLHKDEQTPHIQALVVPLLDDARGLNAKHWTAGRAALSAMQDSYGRAMEPLGLERGVKGSVADHQTVKEFYAKIEAPTPAPEIARQDIAIERPGRIVRDPERYASDQEARIVAQVAPALEAAATALVKAAHYEGQAATAEANITVLQGQVREIARERDTLRDEYKALAAQVRAIPLETVIERLGGQVDRHNHAKWRLDGEHISITGERFYNHDRGQGGGGAIDLVMHAAGYDYKEAVAYLRDTHGAEAAVGAATWHGARQAQREAQEIVEREERPAFHAPEPDEARWPGVRAYLVEQRQIPAGLVDQMHARGTVYADARSNAVFIRSDEDDQAVGASLRGTAPGSDFKGLAAGTRRDEGHFSFTVGEPLPYVAPQIYLTESPIDAMSRAALLLREGARGERVFISTDGHGSLPTKAIDAGLDRRAVVHCGFDRDRGGDTLWERVMERYGARAHETYGPIDRDRPPAGVKDWNQALQQEQARGAEVEQQPRGRQRASDRERGDLADRRPS
jgi:hypothetical protein